MNAAVVIQMDRWMLCGSSNGSGNQKGQKGKRAKGARNAENRVWGKNFNKRQKGQNSSNLVLFRIESWGLIENHQWIVSWQPGSICATKNLRTNIENYVCIYCNITLY